MPEDVLAINKQKDDVLAEWWCELNRWNWPKGLNTPEEPKEYVRGGRRGLLMDMICKKIGRKMILRKWNDHMTAEEFNDFYAGTHEGDEKAAERYYKRLKIILGGGTNLDNGSAIVVSNTAYDGSGQGEGIE
jgi:hypothetical protein